MKLSNEERIIQYTKIFLALLALGIFIWKF